MSTPGPKDDALEGLLESIPFRKQLKELLGFFATRNAVLSGVAVYDLDNEQRAAAGFMGPRPFNLAQSGLSAACAYAIGALCKYIFGIQIPPVFDAKQFAQGLVATLGFQADKTEAAVASLSSWLDKSTGFIETLVVPLTLYLTVLVVRTAAILSWERTPQKEVRIGHAYLYLDGAFGLYSQTLAAVCYTSWLVVGLNDQEGTSKPFWGGVLFLAFVVATLWQGNLTLRVIPARLFAIQGYSPKVESVDNIHLEGPWARYRAQVLVAVPLMATALKIVGICVAIVAGCLLALPELYRLK